MTQNGLIEQYIGGLKKWNNTINLVQRETLNDVYNRHIKDCKQLSKYLSADNFIIDVGSGAGLPGVVLSIMGYQDIVLCEKDYRKCVFLRDVRCNLNLGYEIYNSDIYKYKVPEGKQDSAVCVARAFASLDKLISIMEKLNVSRGVFHKGESYMNEIDEATSKHDFEYTLYPSETNPSSVILEIRRA